MPLKSISVESLVNFTKKYSSLGRGNIAEEIIKYLSKEIKFERVMILYFLNGGYSVFYKSSGLKDENKENLSAILEQIRQNRQSILTDLIIDSSKCSILAAPLLEDGECVGLIYLDAKAQNYKFTEENMRALEAYSLVINPILRLNIVKSQNREFREKLMDVTEELKEIRSDFSEQITDIRNELKLAQLELKKRYQIGNIIGSSDFIRDIHTQISNLSKIDTPVLISGERGSGKELIAKTIHYQSSRYEGQFKVVDCSTISPLVVKNEFLGRRVKGVIQHGLFEVALGGTLYLKNIDQLDFSAQKMITDVIKSKIFKPIGSRENISFSARVIASTTHNLKSDFSEFIYPELLNILKSNSIYIPPLQERIEDIELLCNYVLREISEESGTKLKEISESAIKFLVKYRWPHNVAELEEEIRRSALLADRVIGSEHISEKIKHPSDLPEVLLIAEMEGKTLDQAINKIEVELVKSTLKKTRGNKAKTAKLLGISRTTLYEILSED